MSFLNRGQITLDILEDILQEFLFVLFCVFCLKIAGRIKKYLTLSGKSGINHIISYSIESLRQSLYLFLSFRVIDQPCG